MWSGVDVGGTFTDFVFLDAAGTSHRAKTPFHARRPVGKRGAGLAGGADRGRTSRPDFDLLARHDRCDKRPAGTAGRKHGPDY